MFDLTPENTELLGVTLFAITVVFVVMLLSNLVAHYVNKFWGD